MPCYCTLNGEPVSASRTILTKLLREEMGFDGLCISDYGAIGNVHNCQHVGETAEEAGLLCMEAGMDVEMPNPAGYNDKLAAQFCQRGGGYGVIRQGSAACPDRKIPYGAV